MRERSRRGALCLVPGAGRGTRHLAPGTSLLESASLHMRWTRYFINTLREVPSDADVISQKLMLRAGMIRKVAAGIYTYLPLGLRSMQKLEAIVREEMNAAGAVELLMPAIQAAELWGGSGRLQEYGEELPRVQNRHDPPVLF